NKLIRPFQLMSSIKQNEGIAALFKGLGPALSGIIPARFQCTDSSITGGSNLVKGDTLHGVWQWKDIFCKPIQRGQREQFGTSYICCVRRIANRFGYESIMGCQKSAGAHTDWDP